MQKQDNTLPVYLFLGNEDFLIEQEVCKIKAKVLDSGFADMNYHHFNAKEVAVVEIITVAQTFPAFSEKRLVIVDSIETLNVKEQAIMLDYLKSPSPTTCLILLKGKGKINKKSQFYLEAQNRRYIKQFNKSRHDKLSYWIRDEVKTTGKTIDNEAVLRLLAITGNNLRSINNELHKVILFVGERSKIDIGDIEMVGADVKDDTIFDLADAIGVKNWKEAIQILKRLSTEPPLKILGALSRQFRILWKVKALVTSGTRISKLSSLLRIFPSQVNGYIEQGKAFTDSDLNVIFHRLKKVDKALKGGGLPPKLALERFIIDLCCSE